MFYVLNAAVIWVVLDFDAKVLADTFMKLLQFWLRKQTLSKFIDKMQQRVLSFALILTILVFNFDTHQWRLH